MGWRGGVDPTVLEVRVTLYCRSINCSILFGTLLTKCSPNSLSSAWQTIHGNLCSLNVMTWEAFAKVVLLFSTEVGFEGLFPPLTADLHCVFSLFHACSVSKRRSWEHYEEGIMLNWLEVRIDIYIYKVCFLAWDNILEAPCIREFAGICSKLA